jgi:hypothetical protein
MDMGQADTFQDILLQEGSPTSLAISRAWSRVSRPRPAWRLTMVIHPRLARISLLAPPVPRVRVPAHRFPPPCQSKSVFKHRDRLIAATLVQVSRAKIRQGIDFTRGIMNVAGSLQEPLGRGMWTFTGGRGIG